MGRIWQVELLNLALKESQREFKFRSERNLTFIFHGLPVSCPACYSLALRTEHQQDATIDALDLVLDGVDTIWGWVAGSKEAGGRACPR